MVAPEPADVALDAAFLVGAVDARFAEERLEPVVRPQGDEPVVLETITALQDPGDRGLQVVVTDPARDPAEAFEGPDMGVGERLLRLVHVGPVERPGGEPEPHREQMQRHRDPADLRFELAPIHLTLRARKPGLGNEHLRWGADLGSDLRSHTGHDHAALRLGDQHALLVGETITDPLRRVTLLARRVPIRKQHLANPAMPLTRHR